MRDYSSFSKKQKNLARASGSVAPPGKAVVPTLSNKKLLDNVTCLQCALFNPCKDKRKGFDYSCLSFKVRKNQVSLDDFDDDVPIEKTSKASSIIRVERPKIKITNYSDITSQDFNLEKLVDSITDNFTGIPANLKIDDRDMPEAKNFVEFCCSEQFLNYKPFAKQIEVGVNLFGEICWNPKCSDAAYARCIPFDATLDNICDHVTFLEHGICPHCKKTKFDMWNDYNQPRYNELVGVAGQRASKSTMCAMFSAYTIHRYLKIPNLTHVFNQLPSTTFHATFTATTFKQARETLFDPLHTMVTESNWFKEYHKMLDHYGKKHGEELYKFQNIVFEYKAKGLIVYPSGPDKKNLRGRTRFCLTGDTLVNTTNGLMRLDDKNLLNKSVIYGKKSNKIIRWIDMGKKPTYKITLNTGMDLIGSIDHEIPVINKDFALVEKSIKDIKEGDYIILQLGGSFGRPTRLDYTYTKPVLAKNLIHERMLKLNEFSYHDFLDIVKTKNVWYNHTSRAFKNGWIKQTNKTVPSKHKNKARFCRMTLKGIKKMQPKVSSYNRYDHVFPKHMTPELARILGYMVSEGSYNKNCVEFSFSNTNKQVVYDFIHCYREVFKTVPRIGGPYKRKNKIHKDYWKINIAYDNVKEFLRYLGLNPSTAINKEIPWSILTGDKECAKDFISALFEGDGSCPLHKKGKSYVVEYTSLSAKLLKQLQVLLLKFEVVTKLKYGKTTPSIRTSSIFDAQKFADNIAFITKKSDILDYKRFGIGSIAHYSIPNYYRLDTRQFGKSIKERVWLNKHFYKNIYKAGYAYNSLTSIQQKNINKLRSLNIVIALVKSKKYVGKNSVYDITLKNSPNLFSANGIVVHNCGGCDELGWFVTKTTQAMKLDPDEIYTAMANSFATLRSETMKLYKMGMFQVPTPLFFNVSSPSSSRDKIIRLYKSAKNSPTVYAFKYTTFEFNPTIDPEVFETQRRENPEHYARDYLAEPPDSAAAFISDRKIVLDCVDKAAINKIRLEQFMESSDKGLTYTSGAYKLRDKSNKRHNCLLTLDAGSNHNSFAGVVSHLEENEDDKQVMVVDAVFELIPSVKEPVNFSYVYRSIISPLIEDFNVKYISADKWNSMQLLHNAEADFGIEYTIYSPTYQDFLEFREALKNNLIILPKQEIKISEAFELAGRNYPHCFLTKPVVHLMVQMLTVEDSGKKVDKGAGYTDDLLRAFVLAHALIIDEEVQNMFLNSEEIVRKDRSPPIFVSYNGSGTRNSGMEVGNKTAGIAYVSYNSNGKR